MKVGQFRSRHLNLWAAISILACLLAQRPMPADADVGSAVQDTYIPVDLEDCLRVLDQQVHSGGIQQIHDGSIKAVDMHMGLGLRIRNEWLITRDDRGQGSRSRLAVHFRQLGINHPDDMSGIILESFVRHVKQETIELDKQVAYYKNYWASRSGSVTATMP
jgi:hypothetical protein